MKADNQELLDKNRNVPSFPCQDMGFCDSIAVSKQVRGKSKIIEIFF